MHAGSQLVRCRSIAAASPSANTGSQPPTGCRMANSAELHTAATSGVLERPSARSRMPRNSGSSTSGAATMASHANATSCSRVAVFAGGARPSSVAIGSQAIAPAPSG